MSSSVLYRPTLKRLVPYLAPGVLVYAFVAVLPLFGAFAHSLYSDLNYQLRFVGLQNYCELVRDPDFWFSCRNNLILIGLSLVFQVTAGFLIAVLMNSGQVVLGRFLRTVLFFPVILSPVVVGFLWILIYDVDEGLLNVALRAIGLGGWRQLWLDDPDIVIYSVTLPLIWQFTGFYLVIFLAGLSSIPQELLEAAEIDGASGWQKTLHVTLPLMANTWKVALILAISGGLKVFETPWVMTQGGPGLSSALLAQYAYIKSFRAAKMAYGSTVAMGIVVMSFTLILGMTLLIDQVILRRTKDDAM